TYRELVRVFAALGQEKGPAEALRIAANLGSIDMNPRVQFGLGETLRRAGTSIRVGPPPRATAQEGEKPDASLALATLLQKINRLADDAEKSLSFGPVVNEALQQSRSLARLGSLDEAAGVLNAVIEAMAPASTVSIARLEVSRIRLRQGRYLDAAAVVRPLLEEGSEAREATLCVARAHARMNVVDHAEELFQQLLSQDSQDFEALIELRNLYASSGNTAAAAHAAAAALRAGLSPSPGAKLETSVDDSVRSLVKEGMLDEALAVVFNAVKDNAPSSGVCAGLARALGKENRSAEAVELMSLTIERTPTAEAYFEHGRALARLQRFQPAEFALSKAVELDPVLVIAWLWLARTRRALARYQEAGAAARHALLHGPTYEIYEELGRIADADGDHDSAEHHFATAHELAPESGRAQSHLARIRRTKEGRRRTALLDARTRERAAYKVTGAEALPRSQRLLGQRRSNARIVVFTCCFGNNEPLKEPLNPDPNARFIAYTDDVELRSDHWEVCVLNDRLSNPRRSSRLPKILAHLYLPDHDASIYIDASLQWTGVDVRAIVEECLEGHEIGLYPHFRRSCVYDEIAICEHLGIEHADLISFYRSHYDSLGFPRQAGLFEHGLIVRKNTPATRALNEAWWWMYLGERDQLSLMSAIHTTGSKVNVIKRGKQVRTNDYVLFTKHERRPLPARRPKLYVFVAYAPPEYEQDIGRTYNDYMAMIEDGAYALFVDHDAMFCSPDWWRLVYQLMLGNDGVECLIVGRTNRIGNPYQRVGVLADTHRASAHTTLARLLAETQRDWSANVSGMDSTSGVILMLNKETWKQTPFTSGFLKVDNRMHIAFRDSGRVVLMPSSLYVYHFYRADGDLSHAVVLEQSPNDEKAIQSSNTPHRLKTFIYEEAAGLDFAHYSQLLQEDQWAIFLRADSMFCDKYWYSRAHARLGGLPADAIVLFGNNIIDQQAPRSDDVLLHRQYASARLGGGLIAEAGRELSQDDLIAFMVSKTVLDEFIAGGGTGGSDLLHLLGRSTFSHYRDASTHVFCQACVPEVAADASAVPSMTELSELLLANRRVAILTLGFWPSQAGMELMIHNLAVHLTNAGDLVTLYAPKP
ncbi:MAG: hypothetical protein RJA70_4921, partial [Pseudomonadota bacterium]